LNGDVTTISNETLARNHPPQKVTRGHQFQAMTDTSSKKLRIRPYETAQFCSFLMDDGQPPPTSEEGWKIL
jgi:hypothetical protein